jgi:predicted YcjX-like family ATPase
MSKSSNTRAALILQHHDLLNPRYPTWFVFIVFEMKFLNLTKHHLYLCVKLIVWAPTREKAIERMKRALSDTIIRGKFQALVIIQFGTFCFLCMVCGCPITIFLQFQAG